MDNCEYVIYRGYLSLLSTVANFQEIVESQTAPSLQLDTTDTLDTNITYSLGGMNNILLLGLLFLLAVAYLVSNRESSANLQSSVVNDIRKHNGRDRDDVEPTGN